MELLSWLMKILLPKREVAPEAILSRQISQRISEKAEMLQASLSEYHRAKDPFAALMADLYNRDQVSRIWKNGSGHG